MYLYRVIEIENIEPLKIGAAGSKENQVEPSRDYVPGSTLRGALIHALIQRGLFEPYKRDILLDLECWNAYPCCQDRLFVPVPLHLRIDKHEWRNAKAKKIPQVKLVNLIHSDGSNGKNHLEYRYIAQMEDRLVGYKVPKIYRLHHSTIRNHDKEEKENLFRYQAICENQIFRGIIRYPEKLRSCLDEVFRGPFETYLGGSKGSGYGRSVLKAIGGETPDFQEAKRRAGFHFEREVQPGCPLLTIVCLSDCACRDEYGRPINHIPEAALSEWLQQKVTLEQQWVDHTLTEGYNATWRKRYPKESALRAGSVLVYRLLKRPLSEREMAQLEERLVGARTQDGFGWIGVNLKFPNQMAVEPFDSRSVQKTETQAAKENQGALFRPDQQRVFSIILTGLAASASKEPWLIRKARRAMEDGSVIVDRRLNQSQLYNMIEGLEPVLSKLRGNGQSSSSIRNRRTFQRDYMMDADLCSICGIHYRNLLDGLDHFNLDERLLQFAQKHIHHGKGRLFYLKYEHREALFIAELFHTCLSVSARGKQG